MLVNIILIIALIGIVVAIGFLNACVLEDHLAMISGSMTNKFVNDTDLPFQN